MITTDKLAYPTLHIVTFFKKHQNGFRNYLKKSIWRNPSGLSYFCPLPDESFPLPRILLKLYFFSSFPHTEFNISCLEYHNHFLCNCPAYIFFSLQAILHTTVKHILKMQTWSHYFPALKFSNISTSQGTTPKLAVLYIYPYFNQMHSTSVYLSIYSFTHQSLIPLSISKAWN